MGKQRYITMASELPPFSIKERQKGTFRCGSGRSGNGRGCAQESGGSSPLTPHTAAIIRMLHFNAPEEEDERCDNLWKVCADGGSADGGSAMWAKGMRSTDGGRQANA